MGFGEEQIELQMVSCHLRKIEEIPSVPINTQQFVPSTLWHIPKTDKTFMLVFLKVGLDTVAISNSENLGMESSLDTSTVK